MSYNKKLRYGVGVNDVDEPTSYKIMPEERLSSGGFRRIKCPYYNRWSNMLERCYSPSYLKLRPTYTGCEVCEEWLLFSTFKFWMKKHTHEGAHLDKDFLVEGNKIYSPDTCVFVHRKVNTFIIDRGRARGDTLIGSSPEGDKYASGCNNPFTEGEIGAYIGMFNTDLGAHLAWKECKHFYACQLADSQYVTDIRIRDILYNRYKNYTLLEDHIK